jgi:hypothetical protein
MPQTKSLASLLNCNDTDFIDFIDVSKFYLSLATLISLEMR